jgi:hypothetical protein
MHSSGASLLSQTHPGRLKSVFDENVEAAFEGPFVLFADKLRELTVTNDPNDDFLFLSPAVDLKGFRFISRYKSAIPLMIRTPHDTDQMFANVS